MAIIIRTCPKCGHDLHYVTLDSNPPITRNECFNCGWSSQGELEEVIRIPFGGNAINTETKLLNDYLNYSCQESLNNLIVDDLIEDTNISLPKFDKGGEFGAGIHLTGSIYDEYLKQGF